ncbi:WD40-repeat-containing domain protein, partial [Lasiosphaeris hirsuta]
KIWDPATGQCLSTLQGHDDWVLSVAWSHDSTRLASCSDDKTVKIWDPATGQCLSTLQGHSSQVLSIWDPATSQCLSTLQGHSNCLAALYTNFPNNPASPPRPTAYDLKADGIWITYKGENLMRLPQEYHASSHTVSGTAVAVGCRSGRVLVLAFSEEDPTS